MSDLSHWTPEEISAYEWAIKKAEEQKVKQMRRKEQWLNNFIDGKDMRGHQFDQFVYGTGEPHEQ